MKRISLVAVPLAASLGCGPTFLDRAAAEPGATRTKSGLVIQTLRPGAGASPGPTDVVRVHYDGKLTDGTRFDSSYPRGEPVELPLDRVIPCWTEALQKMRPGEKAKLTCPAEIAYGQEGKPPAIPGNSTLVFTIELLAVVNAAK